MYTEIKDQAVGGGSGQVCPDGQEHSVPSDPKSSCIKQGAAGGTNGDKLCPVGKVKQDSEDPNSACIPKDRSLRADGKQLCPAGEVVQKNGKCIKGELARIVLAVKSRRMASVSRATQQ